MKHYCSKDSTNLIYANWEMKTTAIIDNKMNKTKLNNFFEQKKRFLDLRRKRIYELYLKEDNQNREELEKTQETPEQVRKKMEEKLIFLKEEREKERLELVDKNLKKKFYQSADELRKNDSDALALTCYFEQENQMIDKQKTRQKEKEEEQLYDKLRELEFKIKCK